MTLIEIRDRLLKESKEKDNYVDGVLDLYNEILNQSKEQ